MSVAAPTPSGPPRPLRRANASIRSVAACYTGTVAEGLVFILLTPFLVRRLGLAGFGMWTLAAALSDWMQLFDLGLREAIMKYAAAHQARSEAEGVRRLADSALFAYLILGGVVAATVAGVAWLGVPLLVSDGAEVDPLRAALLVLGISTSLSFPAGLAGSMLEGLSRFDLLNLFRTGHAALRLVLVVIALQFETGVIGVAVAELVSRFALHAVRWSAIVRSYPDLVPRPVFHRGDLARLFGFGMWNAVRQGAEVLAARLYEPVLAMFAGLSSVGAFYAGRRVATMPAEAIVPMAGVLFPLTSELEADGRSTTLRETFLKTTKFALMLALPVAMVLSMGAAPIQQNWLGNRAPEAEEVMQVFAIVFLVVAANMPAESMLLGLGHARLLALCGIAQTVLTLAVGIPLTKWSGAVGLAAGALVAVVAGQAIIQMPLASIRCGVPVQRFIRKGIVPPLLAALPVAVGMYVLRDLLAFGGLASIAAWVAGALGVYAVLCWWIGFDAEERRFVRSQLRRLFLPASRVDDWEAR